ncbi:bifunctional diguanylate cyclase/phosphodiesterase [Sulfurospirillum sp. 1612]|uniref:bifunctional diguanylate cyclase/phosphodiesterase n=1 Tax=Sulfurospirillum sp. 1612 TaxID=3094835 RepID=UPI002F958830
MLYSESKERGNRFAIALKITFPFLILILYIILTLQFINNIMMLVLLTFLVPIYTYYIFYLIYNGFKTTLIDQTTKTFNRKEIISLIEKEIHRKKKSTIILISLENIFDINERYGVANTDSILSNFATRLNQFLENYNFKKTPIGRYGGGNFLLIVRHNKKELKHFLMMFSKELKNVGIKDIEVKIVFSLIDSHYDTKIENIIKKLFSLIDEEKEEDLKIPNIKPNEFENIIFNAIKSEKFFLKYQPSINLQNQKIEIYEVSAKIYSKDYGLLSTQQAKKAISFGGFEKIFDKKILHYFVNEIKDFHVKDVLFSLNISPVSLRDNDFRIYLKDLLYDQKIDPKSIILNINEKNTYEDIKRFNEILLQYKKSGFLIALDHFGGNNCSIEYLKNLPIDIVKFDIEYTKYIDNITYKMILKNLLELCEQLDIKTMIKFIDREDLYHNFAAMNPTYIEGFYVSKPKNLNQIIEKRGINDEIR